MRAPGSVGGATLRLLLASTSVVALLIGGGVPHAYACSISENGATVASVSNGGNIDCISIVNTTVSGNVTNSVGGTITGPSNGIFISGGSIGGAITNAGHITGSSSGIKVSGSATISGGISNSGTISGSFGNGIEISGSAVIGNPSTGSAIYNSGLVSGSFDGIYIESAKAIYGGITNSGTIKGSSALIVSNVSTFTGGITNTGTISAAGSPGRALNLFGIGTFSGIISNSGEIVGHTGIQLSNASGGIQFSSSSGSGTIVNNGAIIGSGGTAVTIQVSGVTFELGPGYSITGTVFGDSSTLALGGTGSDTFALGSVGNSAQYQSFSAFEVVSGTWTASGSAAQAWTVAGGTLAGTGTFAGLNVHSGATLEPGVPGTAGGTLSVAGALTFASGATYLDNITLLSTSEILISGAATLGGATITIASGSTVTAGHTYTILVDSSGGLGSGNIFNPSITYNGMVGTLSYVNGGDDVDLSFTNPCYSGPFPSKNAGTVSGICASNTHFSAAATSAGIVNTGLISSTGITLKNTTITGSIVDSGTLFGGISIDNQSTISATSAGTPAISITGPTFAGGISSAGLLSAPGTVISISGVTTFGGGITNAGTITGPAAGILISAVPTFNSGNISNFGTITAKTGIDVAGSTITGAIVDSGIIVGSSHGILIDGTSKISSAATAILVTGATFTGGISNAGAILGDARGIYLDPITTFGGGISSSGIVSVTGAAIELNVVSTFTGNISNSGTITAKTGVDILGSTITGAIVDSGIIAATHGILIDSASKIDEAAGNVISITGKSFSGGISSAGLLSAAAGTGIYLSSGVTSFSGGITNAGTISASSYGIQNFQVLNFGGGISNAGAVSAGIGAIAVFSGFTFSGGIDNAAGGLLQGNTGIAVSLNTFLGGITNAGTISGNYGIFADSIVTFGTTGSPGGITNSGTISAGFVGIQIGYRTGSGTVAPISTFVGNVSNSGTITAQTAISIVHATITGAIVDNGTILGSSHGILIDGASQIASTVTAIKISGPTFTGGITNSGAVSAGGAGISFASISTFAGNVSNTGTITAKTGILIGSGVTFSGGAAIVNSGTITGSVGAAIDASGASSAVTIDQTAGLLSGAVKLSAHSDVFNVTGGSVAGNIVGSGSHDTLNFNPGASNTFTYTNNFTGIHQANVTSGTVVLNGTNTATGMTVSNAGTLAGTGIIASSITIANGATLEPGLPGTAGGVLSISGSLTFASSSANYLDTINGLSASEAEISGPGVLNGATLTIAAGSTVSSGTTYTIMTDTSGGFGVAGNTFSNSTVTYNGEVGTISYSSNGDDVFVTFRVPCYTGPFPYTNSGSRAGICVNNTSFSGNSSNAGVVNPSTGLLSPTGIQIKHSTINGVIANSGTISGGISIDGTSLISHASGAGVSVTGGTFAGGISNAGTVTGGTRGIYVSGIGGFSGGITNAGVIDPKTGMAVTNVSSFSGGIVNAGGATINASAVGILVNTVSTFQGGITNAGVITAATFGIQITGVSTFAGGNISNSGTITAKTAIAISASTITGAIVDSGNILASKHGILIDSASTVIASKTGILITGSTFTGGITNSGTISAAQGDDIYVNGAPTFLGGITNSGVMTETDGNGIAVTGGTTFSGGIVNRTGATISADLKGIYVASFAQFGSASAGGGITNAGTISVGASGIYVAGGSTFAGGISNSGTISAAAGNDIYINGGSIFLGGITNTGVMTETDGNGIALTGLTSFSGGIVNRTGATISASIRGIYVDGVSVFTGNIANAGAISAPSAIVIAASTIAGAIIDSGNLLGSTHGITVDATSKITAASSDAIKVTGPTFTGGITNAGAIAATTGVGVQIFGVTNFTGGIRNSGTIIAAAGSGVNVENVATFSGGLSNSGTISGHFAGIAALHIANFSSGGIANSGAISVGGSAIAVEFVTTFTGNISNAGTGTITAKTGIDIVGSTITGAIVDSGNLLASAHGILIDSASRIAGASKAISISGPTFTGGISNAGALAAGTTAISVSGVTTFTGGIVNSSTGLISGGLAGIQVGTGGFAVTTFLGGITNAGTITSSIGTGILINTVSTFLGGITNTGGAIAVEAKGIEILHVAVFGSSSAGGGITNAGSISSSNQTAILINTVSTFVGNVSNSGTISGAFGGVIIESVSTFLGNISNSGTVTGPIGAVLITTVSTFSGGIDNTGLLAAAAGGYDGIKVTNVGVFGTTSTGGGIVNSGTLTGSNGIVVSTVATFLGGITNTQKITAASDGILVFNVNTFSGSIVNSAGGAIMSTSITKNGIELNDVTNIGGITNAGTIGGAIGIKLENGVTFAVGGAIINTGLVTGTGGTAIDASGDDSFVVIDQNAGTISGNVLLSSHADTLNLTGGTIVGNIVGQNATGSTLNFSLGGAVTYTDSNTFTGLDQVNLQSGTVLLDGTDSATNIDVYSGATLGGTGTLDPNLTIHGGGTFAPGVPGTFMQVTGSLTLESASIYMITINGANTSGANVTGTAAIQAGALAEGSPASSNAVIGNTYTIMSATTLTGVFADPKFFFGRYEGVLSYDYLDGDVLLTVENGALTPLLPPGAPQNAVNVAHGIDTAIQNGVSPPPGFQNLFNYTPAQLENALAQLEGQPLADAGQGAFQLMTDFLNLLLDPTAGNGGGIGSNGPQQFAPDDQPSLPPEIAEAYNHVLRRGPPAPAASFAQRWTAWGSAFGGYNTTNGNSTIGSANFTASDYGFAAGMTYHADAATSYGFALSGGGTNWNLSGGLGGGRSDAFQVGVYGTTHYGPAYLSGALAFANHWFSTNRIAVGDSLTASFQGQSYAARGEAGYRYGLPVTGTIIGVTPYAAMQVQTFHTPGYSESDLSGGGFGLTYNAMNATDTRGELGARFDNLTLWNDMPLILRGRLAWAHDWVSNPSLGAVFQALPGSSFTVNGATPPKNSALASAAAELHMTANWSLLAKFDGEFAPTAQTYAGTGTLRYSW